MEDISMKVFKKFYPNLVTTLPMSDAIFMSKLYAHSLLPDDLKARVESQATSAEKASYFLDHVIKPSSVDRNFVELLYVMEGSENHNVKRLAELIRNSLKEGCKRKISDSNYAGPSPKRPDLNPNPEASYQIDVSRLKARYKRLKPTSKTDYPKHKVSQYIRLALIEKEDMTLRDDHLNELTKLTLQGATDSILKKKEPLNDLEDIFHYQNEPCPRLILIMGGPGIGKTTLANEICLKWAKDEFLVEDFDVVILIPMRSVRDRSLEDELRERVGDSNYQKLKDRIGSKCLIILEGFDEWAISHRKNDQFLIRLIDDECTILEEATIVITSRPHACEDLNADRKIEIIGFGTNEIKEFVEKSFPNVNQSIELLQQLSEYPHLHSLCYIPMNLVMIVDIYQCNERKLPSTLTELYRFFVVRILQRQVKKKSIDLSSSEMATVTADSVKLCTMLEGIPSEMVEIVLLLSRLAYRGLFDWYEVSRRKLMMEKFKDPRIIFTECDLKQCDIVVTPEFDGYGLLKASHLHQLPADTNTYNFAHLTIQEFLSALHISFLSQEEQLCLLEDYFHDYPTVFTFVCSLIESVSSDISEFIHSRMTENRNSDIIPAVRCINESRWLRDNPIHFKSPFTLNLAMKSLLPYDCVCISFALSHYPVVRLMMKGCTIGDIGVKLLVRHYPFRNATGQLLNLLDLMDNKITIKGLRSVMTIVRPSFTTLQVLDLGKNDIGDAGMAMVLKTLQDNESLTELKVEKCGLSVEGASHISQLLYVTHTLQVLRVSGNSIGDDGMAEISEALRHNTHLELKELWVSQCGLSAKGAVSISKMMMVKHSLQKLGVGLNNVADDGISAIAKALGCCKITELNAMECGIGFAGTKSLASALSSIDTIKALWLQDNPITVEGTQLINDALCNTNCFYIGINSEYKVKNKAIVKATEENNQSKESSQQQNIDDNSSDKVKLQTVSPVNKIGLSLGVKPLTHEAENKDHVGGCTTIQEETKSCHSDSEDVDHV